jgi:hypothetical protein
MLWSSLAYTGVGALAGVLILLAGTPLLFAAIFLGDCLAGMLIAGLVSLPYNQTSARLLNRTAPIDFAAHRLSCAIRTLLVVYSCGKAKTRG